MNYQEEYLNKVLFSLSLKLSELRNNLEETKLIVGIQEHLRRLFESVDAQSQALFQDTQQKTVFQNDTVTVPPSDFKLSSNMKSSLRSFESLLHSLSTLRTSLQRNLSKIPCKEIEMDTSEVLQSLNDLHSTLIELVPNDSITTSSLSSASLTNERQPNLISDEIASSVQTTTTTTTTNNNNNNIQLLSQLTPDTNNNNNLNRSTSTSVAGNSSTPSPSSTLIMNNEILLPNTSIANNSISINNNNNPSTPLPDGNAPYNLLINNSNITHNFSALSSSLSEEIDIIRNNNNLINKVVNNIDVSISLLIERIRDME